jgi:tRNA(Arg) A34 adenosine deaminase TadA
VRINKQGKFRLSKPCEMCHNILKFCGVKKVVYTYSENEIESYKL